MASLRAIAERREDIVNFPPNSPEMPMAAKQNITVAIDGALLKRARCRGAPRAERERAAGGRHCVRIRPAAGRGRSQGRIALGGAKIIDREALHERRRVR
jgi:hypothetical protein